MKKFVDPLSTAAGAPVFSDLTLNEMLGEDIWDILEALFEYTQVYRNNQGGASATATSAQNGFVLTGGVISGSGPYDITAGIAYFPDIKEFARFPAATGLTADGSGYLYINYDAGTTTQKTFSDGVLRDYVSERAASVSDSATSANYVLIDTNPTTVYVPRTQHALQGGIRTIVVPIGGWNMRASSGGDATVNIQIPDGVSILPRNIVSVTASIVNDAQNSVRMLNDADGCYVKYESAIIYAVQLDAGVGTDFDSTDYDDDTINRGYIKLEFLN